MKSKENVKKNSNNNNKVDDNRDVRYHYPNNKTRIVKRKRRANFGDKIQGIIKYLRSDSYLYSNLLASSSSSSSSSSSPAGYSMPRNVNPSGLERNQPVLRKNNKEQLKEKLIDYLKSDTYLYVPLEDVTHRDEISSVNSNIISYTRGQVGGAKEIPFTRVTSAVVSKKIILVGKQSKLKSTNAKHGDLGNGVLHRDVRSISPPTPAIFDEKKQTTRRSGRLH